MDDLRSRAEAFLSGPCILGEPWRLISRYVGGEPWDDSEMRDRLSRCLQTAQAEAARHEGTKGPERDARLFYQKAAVILKEIQTKISVGRD